MSGKPAVSRAIVVEGKYDKIRLLSVIDAVVLVTNGFGIYKDSALLELIRHYARTCGIVILTDADAAGFQIRGYLKGAVDGEIYDVYIPGIHGVEPRKRRPSKEGLLGVEGMDKDTLLRAFERAGVFSGERPKGDITPLALYEAGLCGGEDSAQKRRALLKKLSFPERLSSKALCEVLSTMTSAADLPEFLRRTLGG